MFGGGRRGEEVGEGCGVDEDWAGLGRGWQSVFPCAACRAVCLHRFRLLFDGMVPNNPYTLCTPL